MTNSVEAVARTVWIGVGATMTMDLWAAALRRLGVPSLNFAFLGRWIGNLSEGRFIHQSIAKAAPVRGERLIGWSAHYAIGISFAALLVSLFGLSWARSPSLFPALLIGVVTVGAPLLVLQPALGAGIASSRTSAPVFNTVKSVVTHVVYGFGLYAAALLGATVFSAA